ncbi:MAG: hypothetical protein EBZ47_02060 [Chlamydiae bacterium]|nr:hypothetical protein [Chlamydiota bacterium]
MNTLNFFFFSNQIEARLGFCDVELARMASSIPELVADIKLVAASGFQYAGDTASDSKACTDMAKKKIYIGRSKSVSEACLSLAYEITNAKNACTFKEIQKKYLSDKAPTSSRAIEYALSILRIEAEAVFHRSKVAISIGLQSQIKNKKYLEIVQINPNAHSCIEEIFSEMQNNGTVHHGKKKALDHYISEYFKWNRKA